MDDDPLPTKIILVVLIFIGMLWPRPVALSFEQTAQNCSCGASLIGLTDNPFLKFVNKQEKKKQFHGRLPRAMNKRWWSGNGTCVPYARHRTGIMIYGWAGTFMERAGTAGYATSSLPTIGGMVITNESRGHVAVIEDIQGDTLYISEQNFKGRYIISNRTLSISDPRILGYIY